MRSRISFVISLCLASGVLAAPISAQEPEIPGPSFKDVLYQSLGEVNRLQQEAQQATENLGAGRSEDIGRVLIATQKAEIERNMAAIATLERERRENQLTVRRLRSTDDQMGAFATTFPEVTRARGYGVVDTGHRRHYDGDANGQYGNQR